MRRFISQRELRGDLAAVLREVQGGATVVITRNGAPVAEMRPLAKRRFVPRECLAAGAMPKIDHARFRATVDAVLDQRLDD